MKKLPGIYRAHHVWRLPCAVLLFFISLCFQPCLAAQEFPEPVGYINDFAGVMKEQDIETTRGIAASIKEKTGAELAIATVQSMVPYGSIEEYSIALAEKWGIGEKGKDNGVLLILAVNERKVRIEVGYGLEGAIPDSMAGRILDTAVIPAFREDDFSGGLVQGYRAIAACVAKEYGVDYIEADIPRAAEIRSQPGYDPGPSILRLFALHSLIIVIIFLFIGFIFVAVLKIRNPGSTWKETLNMAGSFGSGGSFGSSDSGFSSSSSSSDSFGGGSFGGGGASRDF